MIGFDLFKLYDSEKDIRPFSWICFDKNDGVKKVLDDLLKIIKTRHGLSPKRLARIISERLKCHPSGIERYFYTKKWIAIPVILEMLEYVSEDRGYEIKKNFIHNAKLLKCAGSTSEAVKAVKQLTPNLCKIVGIHGADGTLVLKFVIYSSKSNLIKINNKIRKFLDKPLVIRYDKWRNMNCVTLCAYGDDFHKINDIIKNFDVNIKLSYFFRVVENYKKPIKILSDLIYSEFGLRKKPIKFSGADAWTYTCANKILIRYLNLFFNFPLGDKSSTVDIPYIIKKSSYEYQRSFWSGFLQFDGSVEWDRRMSLYSSSKRIIISLGRFLENNKIKVNYHLRRDKKGQYNLKFYDKSNKLDLFFEGTLKYQKITRDFNKKVKNIDETLKILKKLTYTPTTKITADKLFLKLRDIGSIDSVAELHRLVSKDIDIERTSLSTQLNILEFCNIVKSRMNWRKKEYMFNDNIDEWRFPDIEVG
jgi:hypothetical protein